MSNEPIKRVYKMCDWLNENIKWQKRFYLKPNSNKFGNIYYTIMDNFTDKSIRWIPNWLTNGVYDLEEYIDFLNELWESSPDEVD